MIKVSLDEAYVFDLLSINQVKIAKSTDEITTKKTRESYVKLRNEIVVQIGVNKFESIIKSQEYLSLVSANERVFDLVEKAKQSEGLAHEMDRSNYDRYIHKISLQKKFFQTEISEVKIGY